jgi:hypothetical protein
MELLKLYLMNWLRLLDEAGNVLTGGDANETISSRAGKAQRKGKLWGCVLCRFLDLFQKDHCELSIHEDAGANATHPD